MGLQDATHLFVYGFNPGEVLDLEFYTACRATGPRRGEGLSFSRITGGQIRVNGDGYAFVSIPPDIKAAGWTVLYALLGRATCAPTAEAARVGALLVDAKRRDRELGG
jgi:hypothetical protein